MRRNMKAGFMKAPVFTGMYGSINIITCTLQMMALLFTTDVQDNTASVNIETPVENQNLVSSNCTVSSVITDRDGKIVRANK